MLHLLGSTAEIAMVPIEDGPDGIAEVAQQTPAVGHLDRVRRALADAVSIGTRTVAGDDLGPGMPTKPCCEGLGLAVRQEVHNLVTLQVDEDGALAVCSSPGAIIHPKKLQCRRQCLGDHRFGGHAQQRVRIGRDGKPLCQPRGGLTAKSKCDVTLGISQPRRSACPYCCDQTKALREDLSGTCRVQASEAPRRDPDGGRPSLPRKIAERARIVAMETSRRQATIRTVHLNPRQTGFDGDLVFCRHHAADLERSGYDGQEGRRHEADDHGCESALSPIHRPGTSPNSTNIVANSSKFIAWRNF